MLYPEQVSVNEKNIGKLTAVYKEAYRQIVSEIETATDFGIDRRKRILTQIDKILIDLKVEFDDIATKEIAKAYKGGAENAISQLSHIGADVSVAEGFDRIHRDAIVALVDDTSSAIGESIQGVHRSAQRLLSSAVKEQLTQSIATGRTKGETLRQVRNTLTGILKNEGLDSLVDRSGRGWTLDRYTEMLIRTKTVEARNRGLVNRIAENQYDLVQVSAHGATDVCGDWEGKILSVSGDTDGYPTVADAEADGLFHPNCRHAINALVPELASITEAYNPNIDTLSGEDFVDEVDDRFKNAYRPPDQKVGTKTPAR